MTTTTRSPTRLTSRSVIDLRWSTAPRNVGYETAAEPSDIAEGEVSFSGTVRQVRAEIERIRRNVGGAFLALHYTHRATGRVVSRDEFDRIGW